MKWSRYDAASALNSGTFPSAGDAHNQGTECLARLVLPAPHQLAAAGPRSPDGLDRRRSDPVPDAVRRPDHYARRVGRAHLAAAAPRRPYLRRMDPLRPLRPAQHARLPAVLGRPQARAAPQRLLGAAVPRMATGAL